MITQYLKWDQVLEVTVFMSIGFGEHLQIKYILATVNISFL